MSTNYSTVEASEGDGLSLSGVTLSIVPGIPLANVESGYR